MAFSENDCVDKTVLRRLLAARALRSLGQGMLVVDFPLYLVALRWNSIQIGTLFASVVALHATLTLVSGPLSDRLGRKGFLISYECALLGSAVLALFSRSAWAITVAAIAGGFGRGINGAAGPFGPIEQAWLARVTPFSRRGVIFSMNTAIGSAGMAAGAFLAMLPVAWQSTFPGAAAYQPLFSFVAIAAVLTLWLLCTATEQQVPAITEDEYPSSRPQENRRLFAIAKVNAINGVAIGLIGPLIAYWFFLRYGVGPGHIGLVLGLSFAATAATATLAGRISHSGRVVATVVRFRAIALGLLLIFPLMPTFGWAAAIYVLRAALNRGTVGARQALNLSLVQDRRRGLAATLSSLSTQMPRALGPIVAGAAFQAGLLITPFYVAAGLQAIYLFVYQKTFSGYEQAIGSPTEKKR